MPWKQALRTLADRLAALAETDHEFRDALGEVAREVMRIPPGSGSSPTHWTSERRPPEPTHITYGSRGDWVPVTEEELAMIEQRSYLKCEGARWAVERQERLMEQADYENEIAPLDRELIERARSVPECYLWMNHKYMPHPGNIEFYDDIGGCFSCMGEAVNLVLRTMPEKDLERDAFEGALNLLAEAQSSVRAAVARALGEFDDTDQFKVFRWLRAVAQRDQIFIQRYMRADDRADPTQWQDLQDRLAEYVNQLEEMAQSRLEVGDDEGSEEEGAARRRVLARARYVAKQLNEGKGNTDEHWRKLVKTFDELVTEHEVPLNNVTIRNLLLPIIDGIPALEETPASFVDILRELDRFLAARERDTNDEPPSEPFTPEVADLAQRLDGRTVAIVGGDRRAHAETALIRAFGLDDAVWIETFEAQALDTLEPLLRRADVSLVLGASYWMVHSVEDLQGLCVRHGKPFVRLGASYHPNQVAHEVLAQAAELLPAKRK